jgi:acyl-coenzyme A synthetase/AMP-(fatty) acid ligase
VSEITNVAYALDAMSLARPHDIAIYFPDRKNGDHHYHYQTLTYRQLNNKSNTLARGLLAYGFKPGDRVALMVTPSLDFFTLSFALFKAGIVPVLIDPGIGLKNLKRCLAEAAPVGFIGVAKAQVARILFGWSKKTINKVVNVGFSLNPTRSLPAILALGEQSNQQPARSKPTDTAAIVFTSGSTGPPKGVVYSHGNFVAQVELLRRTYQVLPGEIDLPTFPLFALFNPAMGMSSVIPVMDFTRPAAIDPQTIIAAIKQFNISNMFGSPALLNTLSKYTEQHQVKLPSLKRVISAGAPVQPKIVQRLVASLSADAQVHTPYGATEALPVCSADQDTIMGLGKAGFETGQGACIGEVCEGVQVAIIAISEQPIAHWQPAMALTPYSRGEIVVKAKHVTHSYFNRDNSTMLAKIADGDDFWHRMGDIGYTDDRGRLWFCGRKGHAVVVDQQTLFSVCCEGVFNALPGVYRSALVRLNEGGRTAAGICVELEPTTNREQIMTALIERAAQFEHTAIIQRFFIHPSFPVDIRHNAKIDRDALSRWADCQ